jgi:hypothetical protein
MTAFAGIPVLPAVTYMGLLPAHCGVLGRDPKRLLNVDSSHFFCRIAGKSVRREFRTSSTPFPDVVIWASSAA